MSVEAAQLPEGTVTVLSTDLVGSTLLNQRLGDEAATAVERELAALAQEQVEKQRGVVVKDTGDGLMVAFQSARRAVVCAQEIQRAIARRNRSHPGSAVQLRVGLHTGEVLNEAGGLHGETLIIAKRIETVAPAGGILASDTLHGVLGTARGELVDRGEFTLKGIDAPWRLWDVPWADTETSGVLSGRERTPFVGRAPELRTRGALDAALDCAIAIQQELMRHRREHGFSPRVRIGVHAAEASSDIEGYSGIGVHHAARIGGLAQGDEIVVSNDTLQAAAAPRNSTSPRSVTLKGIAEPILVVSLTW